MAINVPTPTPNAPQAVNPEPFLSAYLSRPTPYQVAGQQIGQGLENLVGYQKYQQQRQLEALKAIADLYGAGGPRAVQGYGQTINNVAGTQLIPDMAGRQAQGQAPSYAPANGGGGLPSNGSTAPQSSAQTLPSPMPMGQGGTGGTGVSAGSSAQPYGQNPGYTSPSASSQGSPQTIGGQQGGTNTLLNDPAIQSHAQGLGWQPPSANDYASQLQGLQGQMQQFNDQGKYGATQQEGLAKQVPIITAQMNDARQREQFNRSQGMEQNKTIASEVSKQSQDSQQIRELQILAGNMQKALGPDLGVGGNIKGDIYQLTGGRKGSAQAANMQNSTIPLATGLNTVLSHRFNAGEVAALGHSLVPQPKDTPQYRQQKLQNLNSLLGVMASGNEQNVRNVAAAIMNGTIPSVGTGVQTQTPQQIPQGRITVKSPTGQIGHIPANQLQAAIAQGYTQQ